MKHTSTVAKLKENIAEVISEQLPVVVEKVTTQVNRTDSVLDWGHLGPPVPPSPAIHQWTSLINVMKLEFRVYLKLKTCPMQSVWNTMENI